MVVVVLVGGGLLCCFIKTNTLASIYVNVLLSSVCVYKSFTSFETSWKYVLGFSV